MTRLEFAQEFILKGDSREDIIIDWCPMEIRLGDPDPKHGCPLTFAEDACTSCWEMEFISDEQLIKTINNYLSKHEQTSYKGNEERVDMSDVEKDAIDLAEKEEKATRESTLNKAKVCVLSDREGDYGSPEDNFRQIAKYWMAYLSVRYPGTYIRPDDVAVMMALMKIARTQTGKFKEDNFIDGCGYLACASEISYNSYIANKA